jgi:ATP-dependent DNA helicase UvrD/PcrA
MAGGRSASVERVFDVLDGLNREQRMAATHDAGPLRVLAGPGTGKTTTLTARVAWLVAGGVPPDRILLLTFTRRAARQMLARTQALLAAAVSSAGAASRVRGGTFHAVGHQVLRRHAFRLGLPDGFGVVDQADAADLLDLVRADLGLGAADGRRFPRKVTLLEAYSRAVNTGRPLSEVLAESVPWAADRLDDVVAVCRGYVARKRALGLLDFDDLLLYWRAAALDAVAGPRLRAGLDHVLVDEYQDVNAVQVDILRALRTEDARLTVVGDDAQAVYGFRGADARHILDVPAVFPGTTTVVLDRNYRSGQLLLDAANAVAADAPEGFTAVLRAVPGAVSVGSPTLWRCRDEDDQVAAVCERVLAHREEGLLLKEQAVLMRAAHHSDALELELSLRRIPYVKYGGLRFLEAAHVKDLLAAFRLADNPRDELAWFRLLQLLPGVGPATARRAVDALGVRDEPVAPECDVHLRWPLAAAELPASARPLADGVVAALPRLPLEAVGTHAERLAGAIGHLVAQAYAEPAARLADLEAVVAAASHVVRLSDVAADHVLEPPVSTADLAGPPSVDEDWLVLSTLHSAKGLEWEVVHLIHASDGNVPSDMALTTPSGLEEERRLFYVGVTRPRRALHVYVPQRYHHHARGRDDLHSWSQPSRFLSARVRERMVERTPTSAGPSEAVEDGSASSAGGAALDAATRVAAQLDALWQTSDRRIGSSGGG